MMIYQNFDLEIISPQEGQLCARVLDSPQGDCPFTDVRWPFDAEEENELLAEISGGVRQRRARASNGNTLQDYGGKLFEAVFSGDIEHLFRSSIDTAFRSGKGLRVRLRLPEDSELHGKPWEYLFDTERREFLAVREHTPLVRYLPVAQPIAPIAVDGPLRVLVALSSPTDHPRLDIAREWDILCQALEPSISAGRLELSRVPGLCTFDNLRDALRHSVTHVFHFVGHGLPGALVLEQESRKGLEMEATRLRSAFPSGALPRLIVLNACSGATSEGVPFSGLAQGFLRQGVPAVVAMQASITDDAALIFSRYFYRDLIETGAVDASLTEARLRMQGNGHPMEWGTPVLYMRALSGQLFQPSGPAERKRSREVQARAAMPPARTEPIPGDRKKTRESAPSPQSETSTVERKRRRTARAMDNPPLPVPEPHQDEERFAPNVQAREPPPRPRPIPVPEEQHVSLKATPAPAPEAAPPPPPQPAPPPVEQPVSIAARDQARKPRQPPRLEPLLAEQDVPSNGKESEPFLMPELKPQRDQQGIPAGPRKFAAAMQETDQRHKRLLVAGLGAGLLLVALAIATGVNRLRTSPAPATPPPSASRSTPATTSAPFPAPTSVPETAPSPANHDTASRELAAGASSPAAQGPEDHASTPVTRDRPATAAPHRNQRTRKAASPEPVDNCRNPEVGNRNADCLFRNEGRQQ